MTAANVDSSNPLPLCFQVYKSLLERIQRGDLPPRSFLPSDRQLTEDYGVSRITLIKALNELFYAGWPKAISAIVVAKGVFGKEG